MAKFDPKKYKVDTTPLSKLTRLTTEHLQSVLKYWSQIGNNRYQRMKKLDPMYSSLLSVRRGGKFGKSGTYKNRATTINELQRIKNIAPSLTKANVMSEAKAIEDITKDHKKKYTPIYIKQLRQSLNRIKKSASKPIIAKVSTIEKKINELEKGGGSVDEVEKAVEELRENLPDQTLADSLPKLISEQDFRRAFAIFAQRGLNISAEKYAKIKEAILKMKDRDLMSIVDLIEKFYVEYSTEFYEEGKDEYSPLQESYEEDLPW